MSIYGYLSCVDSKAIIWLGKAVYKMENRDRSLEERDINYYKVGDKEDPPNAQQTELNSAIWKMLAEHHLHHLHVVLDYDDEFDREESGYTEIGGDTDKDISFEEYLKDWPG
jgi:hypothetical protein